MSELTQDQLVEKLGDMSVMELCQLTRTLEEKWGVKAAPPAAPPGDLPPVQPPQDEKTEFDVVLQAAPADKKIAVIKAVREVTGLGLKEAKDLVDGAPKPLKTGVSKADADEISKKVAEAGGQVSVS